MEKALGFLHIYQKNGSSKLFPLKKGKTIIGTSLLCDIRLKNEDNLNCALESDISGVFVLTNDQEDKRIIVNEKQSNKYTVLKNGDFVQVGKLKFQFTSNEENGADLKVVKQAIQRQIGRKSVPLPLKRQETPQSQRLVNKLNQIKTPSRTPVRKPILNRSIKTVPRSKSVRSDSIEKPILNRNRRSKSFSIEQSQSALADRTATNTSETPNQKSKISSDSSLEKSVTNKRSKSFTVEQIKSPIPDRKSIRSSESADKINNSPGRPISNRRSKHLGIESDTSVTSTSETPVKRSRLSRNINVFIEKPETEVEINNPTSDSPSSRLSTSKIDSSLSVSKKNLSMEANERSTNSVESPTIEEADMNEEKHCDAKTISISLTLPLTDNLDKNNSKRSRTFSDSTNDANKRTRSDCNDIATPRNNVSAISITPLKVSKRNSNKSLLEDTKSSTPKSALKLRRSGSIYRPIVEDISPVTPRLRPSTLKKSTFTARRSVKKNEYNSFSESESVFDDSLNDSYTSIDQNADLVKISQSKSRNASFYSCTGQDQQHDVTDDIFKTPRPVSSTRRSSRRSIARRPTVRNSTEPSSSDDDQLETNEIGVSPRRSTRRTMHDTGNDSEMVESDIESLALKSHDAKNVDRSIASCEEDVDQILVSPRRYSARLVTNDKVENPTPPTSSTRRVWIKAKEPPVVSPEIGYDSCEESTSLEDNTPLRSSKLSDHRLKNVNADNGSHVVSSTRRVWIKRKNVSSPVRHNERSITSEIHNVSERRSSYLRRLNATLSPAPETCQFESSDEEMYPVEETITRNSNGSNRRTMSSTRESFAETPNRRSSRRLQQDNEVRSTSLDDSRSSSNGTNENNRSPSAEEKTDKASPARRQSLSFNETESVASISRRSRQRLSHKKEILDEKSSYEHVPLNRRQRLHKSMDASLQFSTGEIPVEKSTRFNRRSMSHAENYVNKRLDLRRSKRRLSSPHLNEEESTDLQRLSLSASNRSIDNLPNNVSGLGDTLDANEKNNRSSSFNRSLNAEDDFGTTTRQSTSTVEEEIVHLDEQITITEQETTSSPNMNRRSLAIIQDYSSSGDDGSDVEMSENKTPPLERSNKKVKALNVTNTDTDAANENDSIDDKESSITEEEVVVSSFTSEKNFEKVTPQEAAVLEMLNAEVETRNGNYSTNINYSMLENETVSSDNGQSSVAEEVLASSFSEKSLQVDNDEAPSNNALFVEERSIDDEKMSNIELSASRDNESMESDCISNDISYSNIDSSSEEELKSSEHGSLIYEDKPRDISTKRLTVFPENLEEMAELMEALPSNEELVLQIHGNDESTEEMISLRLSHNSASDNSRNDISQVSNALLNNESCLNNDLSNVTDVDEVTAEAEATKSHLNDLTSPVGDGGLMATPTIQKSPHNDLTNIKGVKTSFKTPRAPKSPLNDLTNPVGVKTLMATPKIQKSPQNDLTNIKGVKTLLKTPTAPKSPLNDLTNPVGVKTLMATPKIQKSPQNDLTNIKGVKTLLKTPRAPKSPLNDLTNPVGVKTLMATPKIQKSPQNDLTNVAGVKALMETPKAPKSPLNDLTNPVGVKTLMATPKIQRSPKNDLTNVKGVKRLMATPKEQKSPLNDLTNPVGVKALMATPKIQNSPRNDLMNVTGVAYMMATPNSSEMQNGDVESSKNLNHSSSSAFDILLNSSKSIKTYSKSPNKSMPTEISPKLIMESQSKEVNVKGDHKETGEQEPAESNIEQGASKSKKTVPKRIPNKKRTNTKEASPENLKRRKITESQSKVVTFDESPSPVTSSTPLNSEISARPRRNCRTRKIETNDEKLEKDSAMKDEEKPVRRGKRVRKNKNEENVTKETNDQSVEASHPYQTRRAGAEANKENVTNNISKEQEEDKIEILENSNKDEGDKRGNTRTRRLPVKNNVEKIDIVADAEDKEDTPKPRTRRGPAKKTTEKLKVDKAPEKVVETSRNTRTGSRKGNKNTEINEDTKNDGKTDESPQKEDVPKTQNRRAGNRRKQIENVDINEESKNDETKPVNDSMDKGTRAQRKQKQTKEENENTENEATEKKESPKRLRRGRQVKVEEKIETDDQPNETQDLNAVKKDVGTKRRIKKAEKIEEPIQEQVSPKSRPRRLRKGTKQLETDNEEDTPVVTKPSKGKNSKTVEKSDNANEASTKKPVENKMLEIPETSSLRRTPRKRMVNNKYREDEWITPIKTPSKKINTRQASARSPDASVSESPGEPIKTRSKRARK